MKYLTIPPEFPLMNFSSSYIYFNDLISVWIGGCVLVKPILESLHWLPISSRIDFKIALLTYKCLNGLAPQYLADLLVPYNCSRQLRSSNKSLLKVPTTKTKTFGSRAFTYAAPTVWNELPENIKKSNNVESFKKMLKSHYFKKSYGKSFIF